MKKRLLFVSDKAPHEAHNAIDSLFDGYLKAYLNVDILSFGSSSNQSYPHRLTLPKKHKRRIAEHIDIQTYDYICVRNRFDTLASLLPHRYTDQKIGLQLSFPHSYRRWHQAKQEGHGMWRKGIAYLYKNHQEQKLLRRCDFFFPITQSMKSCFYPSISTPTFPIGLGIDPANISDPTIDLSKTLRIVYIGTIDRLRGFNDVLEWLVAFKKNSWHLDIYTSQKDAIDQKLLENLQGHLHLKGYLPHKEILKILPSYDIGLFLIHENPLYFVASPTKVMEYYQCGIPALTSPLPECLELFDERSAFFCRFDERSFYKIFKSVLETPKERLLDMAKIGQQQLLQKRNYKSMAKDIIAFLESL